MKDVQDVYCAMQKYHIITIEVRKILLNETNESASPLFHHYKRLLRTRTRAVSNHLTPLVQDSARSSAFDRSSPPPFCRAALRCLVPRFCGFIGVCS
jgi:hypothetical protein